MFCFFWGEGDFKKGVSNPGGLVKIGWEKYSITIRSMMDHMVHWTIWSIGPLGALQNHALTEQTLLYDCYITKAIILC